MVISGTFWNEKRQEELAELVSQKLQASQIAVRLGTTRNAIIGRCNRTNLKLCGPVRCEADPERLQAGAATRSARVAASAFFVCGHPRIKANIVRTTLKKNKCGTPKVQCRICRNKRASLYYHACKS